MTTLTPETVWNLNDTDFLALLESEVLKPIGNTIRFYAPSFTYYRNKYFSSSTNNFPTISITGNSCALNCKHCGGKILQTMHPASTQEELFHLGTQLKLNGAKGCLISGGCLPDGSLPLDKFVPTIGRLKKELNLTVFIHTGIISDKTVTALKEAKVDAALIDVVGSNETFERIYNLKVSVQSYMNSLKALDNAKLNFIPHIIVGLNEGKLEWELEALKMVSTVKPSALVIIAFMPIRGTEMEKSSSPKPLDISKVTAVARLMFPSTPLVLGCMRPKRSKRNQTDVLALKAGVDAVAFPTIEAIEYAEGRGYKIAFSEFCCAQMYADIVNKDNF